MSSLENQLFAWQGWDEMGVSCLQFYDVELIVPIGEFPVGHKFSSAFMDNEKSIVCFYDANDKESKFKLNLSVGEEIK